MRKTRSQLYRLVYKHAKTGSILLDYLVAITIVLMLLPIVVSVCVCLKQGLQNSSIAQDTIATYQFRRMLLLAYDVSIEEDVLYFTYQNKQMQASEVNGNLIIQPGTQMVYPHVEDACFVEEEGVFYVQYHRGNQAYEVVLCI